MLLCIDQVLSNEELELITSKLENADFVDGKITAGWHAKQVKNNTQLQPKTPLNQELQDIIKQALQRNRLFQAATRPKTIRPALFSRYEAGMYYDFHVDNAIMGQMRSDISLTLFLSDPQTYQGGELAIETSLGEQCFKLDAGAMLVYPSSTLHRVTPVTTGIRLAAVSWVQSFIRDADEREILFDLETVKQAMYQKYGKSIEFDLICKTQSNLIRKWVDV